MSDFNISLLQTQPTSLPNTVVERTRRVYDHLAAIYPLSTMLFHSKAHQAALAGSGIRNGMHVLEVATGSGEMFRRLVGTNPNGLTAGLDLSPNMAARTLRRVRRDFPGSRAHCHAVDARRMPFHSETFDALICCYLLELLATEDVISTLGEFYRILRPGCTLSLIMIGQNSQFFNRLYNFAGGLVPAFWGRQIEENATEMIAARGFEIVSDRLIRQSGYPSRVVVARK